MSVSAGSPIGRELAGYRIEVPAGAEGPLDREIYSLLSRSNEILRSEMDDLFPTPGVEVTHLLVVSDLNRARRFYVDVLRADAVREYGGTSAVLRFQSTWLLLVTGGGPTADKPTVTFQPPADPDAVSHAMTLRVEDCRAAHRILAQRGAQFLTPPVETEWEVRAFFRDPDGHLLEISQTKPG